MIRPTDSLRKTNELYVALLVLCRLSTSQPPAFPPLRCWLVAQSLVWVCFRVSPEARRHCSRIPPKLPKLDWVNMLDLRPFSRDGVECCEPRQRALIGKAMKISAAFGEWGRWLPCGLVVGLEKMFDQDFWGHSWEEQQTYDYTA